MRTEEDTDVESARTVSETDQTFLERSLLAAAADQNSRESGSSPPETWQIEELPRQRITSILPLRRWPRLPFLCHGKKLRSN